MIRKGIRTGIPETGISNNNRQGWQRKTGCGKEKGPYLVFAAS
jgi:hypothetical protein